MDHPERQDIDLRNRRMIKLVWRFLRKIQLQGEAGDVAKFECRKVEKELRWDGLRDNASIWDQIGTFLLEQGNEGRIFIDPREFYDHYSWCIEDSNEEVGDVQLSDFYSKFAGRVDIEEERPRDIIECKECNPSTECCQSQDGCLLCLPQVEAVMAVSPVSSLPSPPRTPGTQPLPSYFKGIRLPHPPERQSESYIEDDAVCILLSFGGFDASKPRYKKRARIRRRGDDFEEITL